MGGGEGVDHIPFPIDIAASNSSIIFYASVLGDKNDDCRKQKAHVQQSWLLEAPSRWDVALIYT